MLGYAALCYDNTCLPAVLLNLAKDAVCHPPAPDADLLCPLTALICAKPSS